MWDLRGAVMLPQLFAEFKLENIISLMPCRDRFGLFYVVEDVYKRSQITLAVSSSSSSFWQGPNNMNCAKPEAKISIFFV